MNIVLVIHRDSTDMNNCTVITVKTFSSTLSKIFYPLLKSLGLHMLCLVKLDRKTLRCSTYYKCRVSI